MAAPAVDPSYQNSESCERVGHQHHWPTSGHLEIERCEHYCLFCKGEKALKRWSSAWFLRRHVRDYHIKHEFPTLTVGDGWKSRPLGNTRPLNKKQRAPGSNKKRAGTKKDQAARMRDMQAALYNSLGSSPASSSVASYDYSAGSSVFSGDSISTSNSSFDPQPYYSSDETMIDASAASSPIGWDFNDSNDVDIYNHIGAFLHPEDFTVFNAQVISEPAQQAAPGSVVADPSVLSTASAPVVIDPSMLSITPLQVSEFSAQLDTSGSINSSDIITTADVEAATPFPPFSQEIADSINFEAYLNEDLFSTPTPTTTEVTQFSDLDATFLPSYPAVW